MVSIQCRPLGCGIAGIAFSLAYGIMGISSLRAADDEARFDSPEAAVKALVAATKSDEKGALRRIFGSAVGELTSGDEVQDKADLVEFADRLALFNKLIDNEDGTKTLLVGQTLHPFAIPLVQADGKWFFDTLAGREEILNRRVGDNELSTIAVCHGYVVAQREYAQADRDGDGVIEYAQRGYSTPGKRDGLYWETKEDEPPSPLGPLVAEAGAQGYTRREQSEGEAKPHPYHGYVYRILTKQGPKAPGGAFDYVINGNMVAGFALLAYPATYGNSGVMTFLVNSNGRVLQKNLGEKTSELAEKITAYDPDETWVDAESDDDLSLQD